MKTRIALLVAFGLFPGLLGGTHVHTVELPEYECTAICRPLRPKHDTSGVSHREWLKTEAAILRLETNLASVARNLMVRHWRRRGPDHRSSPRGIGTRRILTTEKRATRSHHTAHRGRVLS
jgi:hypothetical protein